MVDLKNYKELRNEIVSTLDPKDLKRNPYLGYFSLFIFISYYFIFFQTLKIQSFIILFIVSLILGFMSEFLSMASHDILHGSVFKSKNLSLLTVIPFSILTLISPSYWKYWHNFHHASVDRWRAGYQPYEMGFETDGYPKLRKLLGPFELFIFKVFHLTNTQIKFVFGSGYKSKNQIELKRATVLQLIIIITTKILFFYYLPLKFWLFLELLPLLIQNFLSSIFLVTQHSSLLETPSATNTFTVTMPKPLELYSLHLGYHIEHHLIPNISSHKLPMIRDILLDKYQGIPQSRYTLWQALKTIYYR